MSENNNFINAPFTPEQVERINKYQDNVFVHPLTCGNNRTDEKHLDGEGILKATESGMVCPYCDYTQDSIPSLVIDIADYHPLAEFEVKP